MALGTGIRAVVGARVMSATLNRMGMNWKKVKTKFKMCLVSGCRRNQTRCVTSGLCAYTHGRQNAIPVIRPWHRAKKAFASSTLATHLGSGMWR
jgi:hypothetical protein